MGAEKLKSDFSHIEFKGRRVFVLCFFFVCMLALIGRATYLQVFKTQFLKKEGDRIHITTVEVPAYRGRILDRHGEPLAVSTQVESITVRPKKLKKEDFQSFKKIGRWLGVKSGRIKALYENKKNRSFAYLKRRVNPALAQKIKNLNVQGIGFEKANKRFYPAGPVSAHIIGFTDIDDRGQGGLERAYDNRLTGIKGKKRVIVDGKRNMIKEIDVENIKAPVPGQDLILSIDQRLQYLAFRALKKTVQEHNASSASLVVLDAKNGEVLAMVNQPAFNPNKRSDLIAKLYKNRAITDVFEPGSTVKPIVVAAALDGGFIKEKQLFETNGIYRIGRNLVRDEHNYGTLSLMQVLKKSSNIAASKIALAMDAEYFWRIYHSLGYGVSTNIGFPGEASGSLSDYSRWKNFDQATISFGYGVATSVLQLARSYTVFADNGILHSPSLLKRDKDHDALRVFSAATANKVLAMMEHVTEKGGTAYQARVNGYRVAGKTGTVKKSIDGHYSQDSRVALFVGIAPVSSPRFVIAVMVDEPKAGQHFGGQVAAPVFSKVMSDALRIYSVAPDQEETMPLLLAGSS